MISSRSDIQPLISKSLTGCGAKLRRLRATSSSPYFFRALLDRVPRWQCTLQHARDNERGDLASLRKGVFMKCLALLVKMGLTGLRRRELCWQDFDVCAAMSLRTFENLLLTVRDAGFQA
jgi:hypothetical protein